MIYISKTKHSVCYFEIYSHHIPYVTLRVKVRRFFIPSYPVGGCDSEVIFGLIKCLPGVKPVFKSDISTDILNAGMYYAKSAALGSHL